MIVVDILQLGNPILRQKSEHVVKPTSEEVERFRDDFADIFRYYRETTGYGREDQKNSGFAYSRKYNNRSR